MHHDVAVKEDVTHWFVYMLGLALQQVESHASVLVFFAGVVLQVMSYRLRRREVALKELETAARIKALARTPGAP